MPVASTISDGSSSYPLASQRVQLLSTPLVWLRSLLERYFYLAMSLLIAAVVVRGFGPRVGTFLIHPVIPRPLVLYVHAIVFSVWVLFFISQTALVRTGHVRWHQAMGLFGAALGPVVTVIGIWNASVMQRFSVLELHHPAAPLSFYPSLYDMTAFTIPFVLAIRWRKEPEFHRRLMLIATCALTGAAFSRFPQPPFFWGRFMGAIGVDFLLVLGMARDLIVHRHIHRVYFYAFAGFLIGQTFVSYVLLSGSPIWMKIARDVFG